MKKSFLIFAFVLSGSLTFAQDATLAPTLDTQKAEPKFTAALDVVYPYLWRGIKYNGDKVAFQPYMNYAFTDKWSVGVWATTNFSNAADAYNEFDWSISYQLIPIMSVMLSDFYWPGTNNAYESDPENFSRDPYFDYSEGSAQTLDLSILFDFSEKGVPIDFQWSTFIGGNDYKYDADGNPTRAFSSYAEVGYTYSLEKPGIVIRPFIGAAVINGGYYGTDTNCKSGFTFTNVGLNVTKEIKIYENYSLPVFIRYSHNDYGVQEFDNYGNLSKTVRNFFSCGVTFTIK